MASVPCTAAAAGELPLATSATSPVGVPPELVTVTPILTGCRA